MEQFTRTKFTERMRPGFAAHAYGFQNFFASCGFKLLGKCAGIPDMKKQKISVRVLLLSLKSKRPLKRRGIATAVNGSLPANKWKFNTTLRHELSSMIDRGLPLVFRSAGVIAFIPIYPNSPELPAVNNYDGLGNRRMFRCAITDRGLFTPKILQ